MGRLKVAMTLIMTALFVAAMVASLWCQQITTDEQGTACCKEAKRILGLLGVKIDRDILIMVRPYDEVQVQHNSGGGRAVEVGGYYQSHSPESIWIVAGLSRSKAIAVLAHELAHAWQSSNSPLQDRTLKEGFAEWCKWKTLLALGELSLAGRLLSLDDPDYGRGFKIFCNVEEKGGIPAVIQYARTATKP
ncbi:MAG: hypothetical protein RDV48_24870 [Candidatus Eremiobacteraeota bacterium]|nr:hypothetical protein [Candidatus Eremiobacteraeota bacterium]